LWLADGYHRLFAHRAVGAVEIEAEIRRGTREDALRLSLAANATHGKKRTVGDFKRGYDIAVRNGLVEPDDSVGLMELLRCSIRTAEDQTEKARAEVTAKRNAEIIAAIDTDETQVSVAERLGVAKSTVWAVQREEMARREAASEAEAKQGRITQTAETGHEPAPQQAATEPTEPGDGTDGTDEPDPPLLAYIAQVVAVPDAEPDDEPEQDEEHEPVSVAAAELADEATRLRAGMAEIESPEVRMWHDALEALRAISRLQIGVQRLAAD
jgi:hypothetical protein